MTNKKLLIKTYDMRIKCLPETKRVLEPDTIKPH